MKIISVVCQKGGAGKTTIATNLAVLAERAGYRTVLFDLDPQATAAKWGDKRSGTPPDVVAAQAGRLGRLLYEAEGKAPALQSSTQRQPPTMQRSRRPRLPTWCLCPVSRQTSIWQLSE